MLLSNKVYNVLKWTAQYLLPAIGTLYIALAMIWGIPYGEQVVGTVSALAIFIGAVLGLSSKAYIKAGADTDGTLQVDTSSPEKDIYRLQLNSNLENLAEKAKVTLKVDPNANLYD